MKSRLPIRMAALVVAIALLNPRHAAAHPHHDHDTPSEESETAASVGPITSSFFPLMSAVARKGYRSRATLRPETKMDVIEYEIGVEIGSEAFQKTYQGDLKKAQAAAQSLVGNLDRRFLHAAGVKHRLGKVLIRTSPKNDPLRGKVSSNSVGGLNAFRDFWNNNPGVVGRTHDLAVYHVYSAPSGIAYVNTVGASNRYALSCGRGETSWADGTISHEFGHSWNLRHNNDSGLFYEARPRNNRGAGKPGGNDYHVSIMHGGGNHNIGRLSTEEAGVVLSARESRRRHGDPVSDPGPIRPFGRYDRAVCADGKPITIDVVANDHDANNDVLDAQLLDSVSYRGGEVMLSSGSGPGKRNELTYKPPRGYSGKDFFHYLVVDSTGLQDWGAVYILNTGPVRVDTSLDRYNYDFGPENSPIREGWQVIAPQTRGDIQWKGARINARDRGEAAGVNEINRDHVYGTRPATLCHKIANGRWKITLNLGDSAAAHDRMVVRAEKTVLGEGVDAAKGDFVYVLGEVDVRDGELNLRFSDAKGADPTWVVTRLSLERVTDRSPAE